MMAQTSFWERLRRLLQRPSGLQRARAALQARDFRTAIAYLQKYLRRHPDDAAARCDLGVCWAQIGDKARAAQQFELALALDDTFAPALINQASILAEAHRSDDAWQLIRRMPLLDPHFPGLDQVLATLLHSRGDVEKARQAGLRAWLKAFDNPLQAEAWLFDSAYAEIPESTLTAEHHFWAQTLPPLAADPAVPARPAKARRRADRRLRVGYWSPDFRNHSVFYFVYPLLKHHDRQRFEIYAYHDFTTSDELTNVIRACVEHFHAVGEMGDQQLLSLIASHDLDILVELAGHTSTNRLHLLQNRLARIQLTGLGYPPTTGLTSIDGKFSDRHITPGPYFDQFYTEAPFCLPESFWCFDPYWPVTQRRTQPPCDAGQTFTFASVGNISKVTTTILSVWADILRQCPDARLLVRSPNFTDPAAQRAFLGRAQHAGLDTNRLQLVGPVPSNEFLASFNEIDVLLDTYPFNGGTTSAFALYMGVAMVSRYGDGLRSRMGLSMLRNVGLPQCAVADWDTYVERAVALYRERTTVRRFRAEAAQRFTATALGDGERYCRQVETAYREWWQAAASGAPSRPALPSPHLPVKEITRRAYQAWGHGQSDVARRIIDYALRLDPQYLPARLLPILQRELDGDYVGILRETQALLETTTAAQDTAAALIALLRAALALDARATLAAWRPRVAPEDTSDSIDRTYLTWLARWIDAMMGAGGEQTFSEPAAPSRWAIVIEARDHDRFDECRRQWQTALDKQASHVLFFPCYTATLPWDFDRVLHDLNETPVDFVLFASAGVRIVAANALLACEEALRHGDVVSFGGARQWNRLHWRRAAFDDKVSCYAVAAQMGRATLELRKSGASLQAVDSGWAILDGRWLAMSKASLLALPRDAVALDWHLVGIPSLPWEEWVYRLGREQRLRLTTAQNLELIIDETDDTPWSHTADASAHLIERYGFDAAADLESDDTIMSIPVKDANQLLLVRTLFDRGFSHDTIASAASTPCR
ncbi:tetratricopeptide repeat protein [Tepidimonas sp. HKU77]|uniref:O-linked N-acetylglucosamine transferase, SPINDLY family protein n=1 Tax=Tepidimonas sp. HKU77 TaxID=3414503 RepID=UPI003C79B97E